MSGEVPWIYDMIKAHEPTAQASGARILHCCGFDSEPSDLGAHFMYGELKKRGLTPKSIRMVVGPSQGGVRSVSPSVHPSVRPFACLRVFCSFGSANLTPIGRSALFLTRMIPAAARCTRWRAW